jgi:hypothetical protein
VKASLRFVIAATGVALLGFAVHDMVSFGIGTLLQRFACSTRAMGRSWGRRCMGHSVQGWGNCRTRGLLSCPVRSQSSVDQQQITCHSEVLMQIAGRRSPCISSDRTSIECRIYPHYWMPISETINGGVLIDFTTARWLPSTAVVCPYALLVANGLHTIGRALPRSRRSSVHAANPPA